MAHGVWRSALEDEFAGTLGDLVLHQERTHDGGQRVARHSRKVQLPGDMEGAVTPESSYEAEPTPVRGAQAAEYGARNLRHRLVVPLCNRLGKRVGRGRSEERRVGKEGR